MKLLVVGAGFAGATVARTLAEAGHQVLVIDQRDHIGGNAYDYVNEHGIRVHRYGPHIWHTSNEEVQAWASRFTEWVPYRHRVTARLGHGEEVPLPINHVTIEKVFADEFRRFCLDNGEIEADGSYRVGSHARFLETKVIHHPQVTNSRQHVESAVGHELCELFFAPYTRKMWGLSLEDLPAAVAARIPTNVETRSFDYFPQDAFQMLPRDGYTAMFRRILDHPLITVRLGLSRQRLMQQDLRQAWQKELNFDPASFDHIFTSEPIDVFFDCRLGELPWRSIRMHTYSLPLPGLLSTPVVNFTHDGPHTRVTEWKKFPAHGDNPFWTTVTVEEPCDYRQNEMERYYPVKTSHPECPYRQLYKKYVDLARQVPHLTFIGRCGLYQYLDMHMAISSALHAARRFIKAHSA